MILEIEIEQLIASLGFDVYADAAPIGTLPPYVTYGQVGGVPTNTLCGDADGQNARIQFNTWSMRRSEASTMMRQIAALLTQPPLRAVSQGGLVAEYNSVAKLYGARQDLSFWFRP